MNTICRTVFSLSAVALAVLSVGAADPEQLPVQTTSFVAETAPDAEPLDANQCWNRCSDCKGRCSSKSGSERSDCEANCFDSNASCCEANGKKPVFKSCGCSG